MPCRQRGLENKYEIPISKFVFQKRLVDTKYKITLLSCYLCCVYAIAGYIQANMAAGVFPHHQQLCTEVSLHHLHHFSWQGRGGGIWWIGYLGHLGFFHGDFSLGAPQRNANLDFSQGRG